jgi:hypothetical protein
METKINAGLVPTKWLTDFATEAYRKSAYDRYMGGDVDSMIVTIEDLTKGNGGDTVVVPLISRLDATVVRGDQVLSGNESVLGSASDRITVDYVRHGVKITKNTMYKTPMDLLKAARRELNNKTSRNLRTEFSTAFRSIIVPGVADDKGRSFDTAVSYEAATDAQKNAFLVTNTDRIKVGNASAANKASGVWATALGTLTVANDKITAQMVRDARDMAIATDLDDAAGPAIQPLSFDEDGNSEGYVFLATLKQYNDLRADPEVVANYRANPAPEYSKNILYYGGDFMIDDILIRKMQYLPSLGAVGNAGAQVEMGFIAGKAAIANVVAQWPTNIKEDIDYQFRHGVGIEEIRGSKKLSFRGKQFGVVTVFSATATAG